VALQDIEQAGGDLIILIGPIIKGQHHRPGGHGGFAGIQNRAARSERTDHRETTLCSAARSMAEISVVAREH